MRYKLLLAGEISGLTKRFFSEGNRFFECITASLNIKDLENAIKYFQPDLVVYCIEKEDGEQMLNVSQLAGLDTDAKIPLVIVGTAYDYDLYITDTGKNADFFQQKEIPFASILRSLSAYADKTVTVHKNIPTPKESKKRILVIDDSPVMLRTVASILGTDYEVAMAISGKVARRYLQNKSVDLILLDYEMPEENGPGVFKKLRANPDTVEIPVVFLTGVKDASKIHEALIMQPDGYLLKPVEASKLIYKIREVLHQV